MLDAPGKRRSDRQRWSSFRKPWFGLFAAEARDTQELAGFVGLMVPQFEAYFTPCVEIGWRLGVHHWNQGLATEGAQAVLRFGFQLLGLREIVSFAVPANVRSRRVMEKLGMKNDGEFDHPRLPEGHPLRDTYSTEKLQPSQLWQLGPFPSHRPRYQ
jgi:RimJ/RimL family protein N-acetyltransferase